MKTYLYTIEHDSNLRGYNRTINVYRIKNNQPLYIGCDEKINTASYKGDYAIACKVISEVHGHKMDSKGYELVNKNIRILSL